MKKKGLSKSNGAGFGQSLFIIQVKTVELLIKTLFFLHKETILYTLYNPFGKKWKYRLDNPISSVNDDVCTGGISGRFTAEPNNCATKFFWFCHTVHGE